MDGLNARCVSSKQEAIRSLAGDKIVHLLHVHGALEHETSIAPMMVQVHSANKSWLPPPTALSQRQTSSPQGSPVHNR